MGSARGLRADLGGPPKPSSLHFAAGGRAKKFAGRCFRRAAENGPRAAGAPRSFGLKIRDETKIGAGGGTRTRTTFYRPGILSPVRLPFRHTGNLLFTDTYVNESRPDLPLCHGNDVQCQASSSNCQAPALAVQLHNYGRYQKVRDGHKRPVRGLWMRIGRYYARMAVIDFQTGKKSALRNPLGDENNRVDTVPQAVAAMRRLQTKREDNALPVLRRTPKFAEYVALTSTCWIGWVIANDRPTLPKNAGVEEMERLLSAQAPERGEPRPATDGAAKIAPELDPHQAAVADMFRLLAVRCLRTGTWVSLACSIKNFPGEATRLRYCPPSAICSWPRLCPRS